MEWIEGASSWTSMVETVRGMWMCLQETEIFLGATFRNYYKHSHTQFTNSSKQIHLSDWSPLLSTDNGIGCCWGHVTLYCGWVGFIDARKVYNWQSSFVRQSILYIHSPPQPSYHGKTNKKRKKEIKRKERKERNRKGKKERKERKTDERTKRKWVKTKNFKKKAA